MRIIAGRWRSRRLDRPAETTTRPMPDRIKEATFNILGVYYDTPGALPPLRVADLFAGSGSMGLEALSRGAESCLFVERCHEAVRVLRQNLERLGATEAQALVQCGDAWKLPGPAGTLAAVELLFLDPPFADSADSGAAGAVQRFLRNWTPTGSTRPVIVLHHQSSVAYPQNAGGWQRMDEREFGSGRVTFYELRG